MSKKNEKKVPSFLSKLDQSVDKMDGVSQSASYPEFFFDTGSCIINKVMSDRYNGGYGQGRMAMIAGPANSGKSFLAGNAIRQALNAGYGAFVIDSENALDDVYMGKIGVDVNNPNYSYKGVDTLRDAKKLVSEFFKLYREAPKEEQIPYLIVVDSIDELRTDTQKEKDDKGETHNDMGQQVKQLREFQSNIMHQIKHLPMSAVVTKQPYVNQDNYTNKREPYIITQKLRFAYSQILFVTNKLLKDNTTDKFEGINLEVYGYKTRFAKPFQKCVIEVPYESGIDWYSGVLEASEALGIVTRKGSWYTFGDDKFQRKGFSEYKEAIFDVLKQTEGTLQYEIPEEDLLSGE